MLRIPDRMQQMRSWKERILASKAKQPAKRKAFAKNTALAVVQSANQKSAAAKKACKGIARRAVKAVTATVTLLLSGSTSGKPKST
jgi:hypothetical protein